MEIQCECGQFRAEIKRFSENTPGRLVCYCDDCQSYLHHLNRTDLMDSHGGTEIIPVYPASYQILTGHQVLHCTRLAPHGMFRWSTTCCRTPIGNTSLGLPWIGIIHRAYNVKDPHFLERTLGAIKCRIQGRYAKGTPPAGTAEKMSFAGFMAVAPFLLKGLFLGLKKPHPFFEKDLRTPLRTPQVLTLEERNRLRSQL